MFKNIFLRLLVSYLLIIIIVISTLAFILSTVYERYVFREKNETLIAVASRVNKLVNDFYDGKVTKNELESFINSTGYVTDSGVYIVRYDLRALENPKKLNLSEELDLGHLLEDLGEILQDRVVFRKEQYSKMLDTDVVFTGVPLKIKDEIKGAVLFISPIQKIRKDIRDINLIIAAAALLAVILSTIVVYFNSSRISKPIRQIEYAAKKLAQGENTEDIIIYTKDEIASLAKTFNYMKKQISDTEKMRKEFIASVSHDLRTPLTSIKGFVQGMMDGIVKPQDTGKVLNIIKEETLRLIKLTGEILELAKIQSGSIKLHKERIGVLEIINDVSESLNMLVQEKGLQLSVECSDKIAVNVDKDRFKQILVNILSNAIKYNKENGKVYMAVTDKDGFITFSIKDTGIGIPSEELPFIFERFYRVDKSRQSSKGGAGLGLNIVKSLVELHGGRIQAKSSLGLGTEFLFTIPK
ncbi:MAG: HAMP domain-containing histidine kinase [Clostridia bacterium]|nr:HAMP domain-containing histidine kinase [Clostridia bacterium]